MPCLLALLFGSLSGLLVGPFIQKLQKVHPSSKDWKEFAQYLFSRQLTGILAPPALADVTWLGPETFFLSLSPQPNVLQ
jgi:hypothetical protein